MVINDANAATSPTATAAWAQLKQHAHGLQSKRVTIKSLFEADGSRFNK